MRAAKRPTLRYSKTIGISRKASLNRSKTGYTQTAKLLHWLVVLLLVVQYVIAWNMPHMGRNTIPDGIINLHFSLGVLILFVIVLRIFWK